jgi:hypothetical protein
MRVVYRLKKNDQIIYVGSGTSETPAVSVSRWNADSYEIVAIIMDDSKDLSTLIEATFWLYHKERDFADLDRQAYQHYRTEKEAGGVVV